MNPPFTTLRGTETRRLKSLSVNQGRKRHLSASVSRCVVFLLVVAAPVWGQTTFTSKTREHVQTLASERFGGREAGTDGERLAGDYIAAQLARAGAKTLPGNADMFEPFQFTAGSRDGGSTIAITRDPDTQAAG